MYFWVKVDISGNEVWGISSIRTRYFFFEARVREYPWKNTYIMWCRVPEIDNTEVVIKFSQVLDVRNISSLLTTQIAEAYGSN